MSEEMQDEFEQDYMAMVVELLRDLFALIGFVAVCIVGIAFAMHHYHKFNQEDRPGKPTECGSCRMAPKEAKK